MIKNMEKECLYEVIIKSILETEEMENNMDKE
jgi:hypothetical protein